MPTVLRLGPYRFFFYSVDRGEPPHVHVRRDRGTAKFWLDPCASNEVVVLAQPNWRGFNG